METYDHIIKVFDKQIKREYSNSGDLELCPSYWSKLLFIKAKDLNISDWRNIRAGNYYDLKLINESKVDQLKFTYYSVCSYLNSK